MNNLPNSLLSRILEFAFAPLSSGNTEDVLDWMCRLRSHRIYDAFQNSSPWYWDRLRIRKALPSGFSANVCPWIDSVRELVLEHDAYSASSYDLRNIFGKLGHLRHLRVGTAFCAACHFDELIALLAKAARYALRTVQVDSGNLTWGNAACKALYYYHPPLQSIKLRLVSFSCSGVTFGSQFAGLGNLTQLHFKDCPSLSSAHIRNASVHLARLTDLALWSCRQVDNDAVVAVATHCRQLRRIDIRFCERVTDPGICCVADRCNQLETVSCTDTSSITGTSSSPSKATMRISACYYPPRRPTDASVQHIISRFAHRGRQRTELNFNRCRNITGVGTRLLEDILDLARQYSRRPRDTVVHSLGGMEVIQLSHRSTEVHTQRSTSGRGSALDEPMLRISLKRTGVSAQVLSVVAEYITLGFGAPIHLVWA